MRLAYFLLFTTTLSPALAQPARAPNVEEQRATMQLLSFLVVNWSGHARMQRAQAEPLELAHTENAQYTLEGLVLLIEGTGRTLDGSSDPGLATISYDDDAAIYRMRAGNKLAESGKSVAWGLHPRTAENQFDFDHQRQR
jgi:hypothetical protein